MHETLWEMHRTQDQFISQIEMLTQKIVDLQATVLNQQQQQCPQLQPLKLHSISPSPSSCTSKTLKVPGSNLGDIPSESDSTIENSAESYTTSIGVQVIFEKNLTLRSLGKKIIGLCIFHRISFFVFAYFILSHH